MIKVAKFGGSSLADANQFKKVKEIILEDECRKIIVVSAAGKKNHSDNKITDLLYLCHAHIKYSVSFDNIFSSIENRYIEIRDELGLKCNLEKEFEFIKKQMTKEINRDYLVSRGEYLSALLLAEFIDYKFIDAKDVIYFDYNGKVNYEKTKASLEDIIKKYPRVVIPGFYGILPDNEIKLFSRGGSDITGAILANCINAKLYENWTDVSGILMADPSIVNNPKKIEIITYNELRELSYMGANVLHTDAVAPVKKVNIPINIKNTNDPKNSGTLIVNENSSMLNNDSKKFITGIAGKKNFSIISIYKNYISNKTEAIKNVLDIFQNYKLNIEHILTGIDSFSLVISSDNIKKYVHEIISEIKKDPEISEVTVVENISLIATVGRNMAFKPGMSGNLFATIGNNNINIKIISQEVNEINIIVGVENTDFEKTINVIYDKFIG